VEVVLVEKPENEVLPPPPKPEKPENLVDEVYSFVSNKTYNSN
jgi:hypothetical protein